MFAKASEWHLWWASAGHQTLVWLSVRVPQLYVTSLLLCYLSVRKLYLISSLAILNEKGANCPDSAVVTWHLAFAFQALDSEVAPYEVLSQLSQLPCPCSSAEAKAGLTAAHDSLSLGQGFVVGTTVQQR